MRKPLIAGNWKMQGSRQMVDELCAGLTASTVEMTHIDWAVFPPYLYLSQVAAAFAGSHIAWGAQNVSDKAAGAFTGEISADMLSDLQCQYVIVGHSERRTLYNEDNTLVANKFHAALAAGLKPILCVGESLAQRQAEETLVIVQQQLAAVLSIQDNRPALAGAVIAYEPIWAIGTGEVATPEQAQVVHAFIRAELAKYDSQLAESMRIIYGGSVKPDNAAALFAMPDIDGALVGGASLTTDQFTAIGKQCKRFS